MNEFDCQLKMEEDKEDFWRTMDAEKVTPLITTEMDLDWQPVMNETTDLIRTNPTLHEKLKTRRQGSHISQAEHKYLHELFK